MQKQIFLLLGFLWALTYTSCSQKQASQVPKNPTKTETQTQNNQDMTHTETITFGAGCFWCVEAIFQRVEGVISVVSGYSNGTMPNPSYKEVCTGTTGYAEVCQIVYDTTKVNFESLLEIFWKTHDPTTLNRQGADVGTQYRSGIFYHNERQKEIAEAYKKKLNDENVFGKPVVTEITEVKNFYGGEDYHQNYFNENGSQSYCRLVILPKVEKFEKVFKDKMKK